ncbi:23S rRNA (uracil1939-C5)-methyltransferase [Cohaesibacter sp. ES.047]|uniref:class I SAM-dependent RNA methyltransferase n=1 Tax=Cohaesibacter sp. ES.047 TaxID=1798205 RepID=UPI000BC064A4|nr:class I SAM-dependent RNA methyltransferase [Cohaesibacter sp. ES.047]SNY92508.1 23S rRNA (uracil1939-C5)-methyltransferase [Cohaesibacter sp. ES.047]
MTDPVEITIDGLGAKGDGVAYYGGGMLYVPFALEGERVRVTPMGERADLEEVLQPSEARIDPICPLFQTCGGCIMQHMATKPYGAWKQEMVIDALASRGLEEASVEETMQTRPGGRRRAVLTARLMGRRLLFGYHEMRSARIVDVDHCPVLTPALNALLPKLADFLPLVMTKKKEARVTLLSTDSGVDVSLEDVKDLHGGQDYLKAVEMAETLDLARLSANGEVLLERRPPLLRMGDAQVSPPPGAFVQADESAEQAMVDMVLDAVGDAKRVIDLFSGSGTFTLRLAKKAQVWALESEEAALKSLERGWRFGAGLKGIKPERRDLFRRPVLASEMKKFDALVFDPPRAGAKAQCEEIAKSKIPVVVAVSCNPGTLARDLRILVDGGYKIRSVTPVDQFIFSPHVECVAVLQR